MEAYVRVVVCPVEMLHPERSELATDLCLYRGINKEVGLRLEEDAAQRDRLLQMNVLSERTGGVFLHLERVRPVRKDGNCHDAYVPGILAHFGQADVLKLSVAFYADVLLG